MSRKRIFRIVLVAFLCLIFLAAAGFLFVRSSYFQRHLLTFDMLDAPLIHDYEKLFLMEMAISHNDPYLLRFHKEIDRQQFALIITDPLFNNIKEDDEDSLAAENNDWVRQVSRPILCAYETVAVFNEVSIQVLEPNFGDKCDQNDD